MKILLIVPSAPKRYLQHSRGEGLKRLTAGGGGAVRSAHRTSQTKPSFKAQL